MWNKPFIHSKLGYVCGMFPRNSPKEQKESFELIKLELEKQGEFIGLIAQFHFSINGNCLFEFWNPHFDIVGFLDNINSVFSEDVKKYANGGLTYIMGDRSLLVNNTLSVTMPGVDWADEFENVFTQVTQFRDSIT